MHCYNVIMMCKLFSCLSSVYYTRAYASSSASSCPTTTHNVVYECNSTQRSSDLITQRGRRWW